MEPEEAFELLQHIARVSGTENKAYKVTPDFKRIKEPSKAEEETEKEELETKAENRTVKDVEKKQDEKFEEVAAPLQSISHNSVEINSPHTGNPVTIHFFQPLDGASDYRPFKSWSDYSSQVALKAIEEYGLEKVKEVLFDKSNKHFHTPKRDTYADSKEAMRGFNCRQLADGLWFLTNYNAANHRDIIRELEALFPNARSELLYV